MTRILELPLMASKEWRVLEQSSGTSFCPEADLPTTVHTGPVTTSEARNLAEAKCFGQSNLNFFCCESKVYFCLICSRWL